MPFPILGTPKPAFFDSSGAPLASGTLSVLDPATDLNKASYPTYDDANASPPTSPNTNPITLDSRGEPANELWGLDAEDYKLVLKDSTGNIIWTVDDIFLPIESFIKTAVTFTSGDATPTVGGGKTFITAGSTAITDFDDGVVGQAIKILAASSITITDGSPIALKNSANFNMVSGDTLTLYMFNDQVWEEIGRSTTVEDFLTAGTGITTGTGTVYRSAISRHGTIIKTSILIDLTGLRSTGADDIIGVDGTALDCHLGQITAAKSGTILTGKITCLEVPAGGDPDINVYANVESTGSESDDPSGLTGTGILVNTGDHTLGSVNIFTALPAANEYLYLVAGAATDADYTAGKLLIELEGY
jgi:hypothetical protein